MKKSKFYVLFSLLILVLLFSVSALCSQCGITTPATTAAGSTDAAEKIDVGESKEFEAEETAAESTGKTAGTLFSLSYQHGDPLFFAALALNDYYWGDRAIKSSDAEAAGNVLQTFLLSDSTFSCSNTALKNALQNAINAKSPRFQLRIYFIGLASDEDSQMDGWVCQQSDVKLSITYVQGS